MPEDLTVAGFDDVDHTTIFHLYLTTIDQPCHEMGRKSISMVRELLQGDGQDPAGRCFLLHRLVERERDQ